MRFPARLEWLLALVIAVRVSTAAADAIGPPPPPEVYLASVSLASSDVPSLEAERVRSQTAAALRNSPDIAECLRDVHVTTYADAQSVTLVFVRSRAPRVEMGHGGQFPQAARRCIETAARNVRLHANASGTVTVRARYAVRPRYASPHGPRLSY